MKFKEFIKQNPEYKKLSKELQKQRYELYEEQRQNNIERCKSKRNEISANTKKKKPSVKKYGNYEEDEGEDDEEIKLDLDYKLKLTQKPLRNSESYNYIGRISHSKESTKRIKSPPENKILVTASSYIMNSSRGTKSEITKDALSKLPCLKTEQQKLDKKAETKDDHFMRYLKVQLNNAKKIKEVKEKIELKDKYMDKFLKIKNKGKKMMDNERYQDQQDIKERKKIYEKMSADFDQKLYLCKKQLDEKNNIDISKDKESLKKSKNKIIELNEQIKEYEKKNLEYQQKITDLFELKDSKEMNKKIIERGDREREKIDNKKDEMPKAILLKKKLNDMEEKLEIEKYKRERALMNNMNFFQNKINKFLEENEKKENNIKKAMLIAEKEKEERNNKRNEHLNKVRENLKKNEEVREEKRQKILDKIEIKDLKDYAIKQEKNRMIEERKKINANSRHEREQMKLRIQEIIDGDKTFDEQVKKDILLNKLLTETNKKDNKQ